MEQDECWEKHSKDTGKGTKAITIKEFTLLCQNLFQNDQGKPYPVDTARISEIFQIFNTSGDGSMSFQEFQLCWYGWIKKIVRPRSAIVVVDVQNDFITGSLSISNCPAGHNGEDVVAPINKMIDTIPFNLHCYSLDWHPTDHVSFTDNTQLRKISKDSKVQNPAEVNVFDVVTFEAHGKIPKMEQIMWPRHCVQETWGSELHKNLKVHSKARLVHKGCNPDIDSYSAFFDNMKLNKTILDDIIRQEDIDDLYICGIATDVCVGSTAFHAQDLGYRTVMVEDASKGVKEEDIQATFKKIRDNDGVVVDSSEVKAMVLGRDRRPELGYKLALQCRDTWPPKVPGKGTKGLETEFEKL